MVNVQDLKFWSARCTRENEPGELVLGCGGLTLRVSTPGPWEGEGEGRLLAVVELLTPCHASMAVVLPPANTATCAKCSGALPYPLGRTWFRWPKTSDGKPAALVEGWLRSHVDPLRAALACGELVALVSDSPRLVDSISALEQAQAAASRQNGGGVGSCALEGRSL